MATVFSMRSVILGVAIALPLSSMAQEKYPVEPNRFLGNGFDVEAVDDGGGTGYRRQTVTVSENYDVKGVYQYTVLNVNQMYVTSTEYGSRFVTCPVGRGDLLISKSAGVRFETTLVPNNPNCSGGGLRIDLVTGARADWLFSSEKIVVFLKEPQYTVDSLAQTVSKDNTLGSSERQNCKEFNGSSASGSVTVGSDAPLAVPSILGGFGNFIVKACNMVSK